MRLAIVERSRAIGEALANSLAGDPIMSVNYCASVDEFLCAEAHSHHDLVAVAAAAVSNINELIQIAAQSPTLRVALVDEHYAADRATFCETNGIAYLNQDCHLSELRSALLGKQSQESTSASEQSLGRPTTSRDEYVNNASQSRLLASLTPREMQVLRLVAKGYSVRECAEELNLSHSTVDNHKSRMMAKLGVHKSIELVYLAIREGLVDLNDPLN